MKRFELENRLRKIGVGFKDAEAVGGLGMLAAVGFNALGGGIRDTGVFLFSSVEDAEDFVRDAPVSRDVELVEGGPARKMRVRA